MLCVCHVLDSDTFSSLAYGSSVFGRMSSILSFRSQMHWRRETTDHSASNKCQTLIVLHTHSHTLLHTHTPVESWNISDVIINYTELCGIDTTDLPEYTYEKNKGNIRTAQHCKIKICFDFFLFAFIYIFIFTVREVSEIHRYREYPIQTLQKWDLLHLCERQRRRSTTRRRHSAL